MRLTLTALSLLALLHSARGQEQLQHPKKYIVDEEGKIYWNRHLPVYIRLTPDPSQEGVPMKSHSSSYVDPYFLDTEGQNWIRSRWATDQTTHRTIEPKQEAMWEVYADGLPPFTKVDYSSGRTYLKQGKRYASQKLLLRFPAQDGLVGVEETYVSINGQVYQTIKDSLLLTRAQEYRLRYYSVDKVGNVEEAREITFVLDLSSPKTKLDLVGESYENILSHQTKIELKAEDEDAGLSKIQYSLDDGPVRNYLSPISLYALSEGEHTLSYYASDLVGNQEEKQTYEFYLDRTGPFITSETLGDKFMTNGKEYSSGRTRVKLTALDNKAGIKEIFYSLNSEAYEPYDKPFYIKSKNGNTTIRYYAVDRVGNKSQSSLGGGEGGTSLSTPYLDLTGPKLSFAYQGKMFAMRDTTYISPETKIKLSGYDSEAGLQKLSYSLDNGGEQDYAEPFSVIEAGKHTLDYYGYDNVNNRNHESLFFIVDNQGPEIFPTFSITPVGHRELDSATTVDVYPKHVLLFLSASDTEVGFERMEYSINDGLPKAYSSALGGFAPQKDFTIKATAYDKLNNSTQKLIRFGVSN